MSTRCLVLDISYQPHRIVGWQRAVNLIFEQKAELISEYDEPLMTGVQAEKAKARGWTVLLKMPAVIRLLQKVSRKKAVRFSRMNVLVRDDWKCFAGGERVLMADGSQRPIELVQPGDCVIDAYGVPRPVVATGRRTAPHVVAMKRRGSFLKTVTTPEHKFLTPSGEFVPIGDRPEYLVLPRAVQYTPQEKGHIDMGMYLPTDEWLRYRNGRVYWSRRSHEPGFPAVLQHSPELAYFLGLYCAEGCNGMADGNVTLAFHRKEIETLARDAHEFLSSLGLNPTIDLPKMQTPNSCRVRACSKSLSALVDGLCGKGQTVRRTPWAGIGPYHREFLRGLFRGDGYIRRDRENGFKVTLALTSHDLILGAQSMLWGFGIYPTLQTAKREARARTWILVLNAMNYSKFMTNVLQEPVEERKRIFGDDNYVHYRLEELQPAGTDVEVFNIEVEDSNSYIVNGVAVHNCQYCGRHLPTNKLNYDHVVPRSQGGKTVWENIVTSCYDCNGRKENRTPQQAGMKLLKQPVKPKSLPVVAFHVDASDSIPEAWRSFLYWNVELEHD